MSVFHLKYRPQKINELDLSDVSDKLTKILSAKDIPQSFLFAGPKGAGKTSAARILAKAINCLKLEGIEPCGKCENCREIDRGSSVDVMEMDAASNRGIEDVRSLKDKAYLLPSRLKKKVFIVDEVHMLTKEAFNAWLKLIEEPPKNTVFVMCTTDAEKIPETVLSRLMRIDFRKGTKEEIRRSIKKIVDGEGVKIDDEAMEYLLGQSDGSFRNAQKSFNEIFLQSGKKIGLKEVKDFFQSKTGEYEGKELETDLKNGEVKKVLDKLEKIADKGVDFSQLREKWLEYFQKRMLDFYSGREEEGLDLEGVVRWINLMISAGKQEKETSFDQLPLELAAVEFGKDSRIIQNSEIKEEKKEEVIVQEKIDCVVEAIAKEWSKVLAAVKPYNHSVEAFLRAARPKTIEGNILVLEVFYPFHRDKLQEDKNRKIVEAGLSQVLGKSMVLECVLGKSKSEPLVVRNETPMAEVVPGEDKKDIYDVAKEIFG